MKTTTLCQTVLVTIAGVMLTHAGLAQAPNGSVSSPTFSGAGKGLYDLTDVITQMHENFDAGQGDVATIVENVSVLQSMSGALTTTGSETRVTLVQNSGSISFTANYTLKGAVKSAGSKISMTLAFNATGKALFENVNRTVRESVTYVATVDPVAGTMTGRKIGTASASGKGTVKILDPTIDGTVPPGFTPVDWHLDMTLASTGTKVKGTAAVSLDNGRSFPFNVNGTYSAKTGTSKLTLTGTGIGKGATLTVNMAGNNITGISGKLLGQQVKVSRS